MPIMYPEFGWCLQDKGANVSPEDSELWIELFVCCMRKNLRELGERLEYLRGAGCKLVPNQNGGYMIRPIVGPQAWESEDAYKAERKYLMPYRTILSEILKELKLPHQTSLQVGTFV